MKIGVTGANGFLGSRIREYLVSLGHQVVSLTRTQPATTEEWRRYALELPASTIDLSGIETVVHCAYDMSSRGANHLSINATGAAELAEACRRFGVYLINVSSVVATQPTISWYARAKHSCEVSVSNARGTNIRLGLLTDFQLDPFALKMQLLLKRFPLLPLPVPRGWIWQSQLTSLYLAIANCVANPFQQQTIWLGGDRPVLFEQHVAQICMYAGKSTHIVSVPLWLTRMFLWPLEKASPNRRTLSLDALNGMSRPMAEIDATVFVNRS